ncbi:hypothetical protein, partial [Brachyspira catarrhinii]|uniref:hypothetical protein n=1 Tax=Brachyspira catarrhinii TaxID=2528966 RepID=UPI001F3F21F6
LLYLLTNNLNFYISQFFKAFNFLSVAFRFAKTLSLRANFTEGVPLALAWQSIMFGLLRSFHSLAMTKQNNFAILNNNVAHAVCLKATARNDNYFYSSLRGFAEA